MFTNIGKMAAPTKKRAVDLNKTRGENEEYETESNSSESSDSSDGEHSQESLIGQEEIQVDFEGRNPIDSDFHGIKQLLHQLFLKAHLNLSELTDIIIGQNYVGSVIKQAFDGDEDESSDDEGEGNDANDVFGITTAINLTEKQNLECVSQLRKLLLELCREHGGDETVSFVENILGDDVKPVGLLINERFVNIPSQITIPLLKSLSEEIKKAKNKKMPFDFAYFILICKLYKLEQKTKKKKSKNTPDIIWSNQEEEFIENEAEVSFEFSVKNDSDTGLSGRWSESDAEMMPFRKVLIFKANKLDSIIDKLDQVVNKKV